MRGFKIKVVSFIFVFLLLIGVYFVFSVSLNQKASYPNPKNYTPNFWFNTEEKYFPCSPLGFNYDKNLNELPAKEVKAKYDSLSTKEKLNYFTVFYNVIDNGLNQRWQGRVWCNPPYGRETFKWLEKLANHKNGIALIFARTETRGFHEQIWEKANSIFFLKED